MKTVTRKKPTLKSIADHLGVSTATVSNAFNRPNQLSKTLRDSILEESKSWVTAAQAWPREVYAQAKPV